MSPTCYDVVEFWFTTQVKIVKKKMWLCLRQPTVIKCTYIHYICKCKIYFDIYYDLIYLTQSKGVCWTTSHLLFSNILQPQWEPDHNWRSPCTGKSFAGKPEPSEARVGQVNHVLHWALFRTLPCGIISRPVKQGLKTLSYTLNFTWAQLHQGVPRPAPCGCLGKTNVQC